MPKLESSWLNGVAVITKIHTHTHPHTNILPNLGNTLKKFFFAVIDNESQLFFYSSSPWKNKISEVWSVHYFQ